MDRATPAHWQHGDVVVLRYVETPQSARMAHAVIGDPASASAGSPYPYLAGGEVVTVNARPYRVVEDSDDVVALYQPEATPILRWHIPEQRYLENPTITRGETLRFLYPDVPYDITLFFEGSGEVPWFYDALFGSDGLQAGWRERRRRNAGAAISTGPAQGQRFRGWYVNLQSPFRRTPVGFDIVDQTLDIVVRPDRSWYWKDDDELALAVEKGACTPEHAASLRRTGESVIQLIEARKGPFDDTWTGWRAERLGPIEVVPDGWQHLPGMIEDEVLDEQADTMW